MGREVRRVPADWQHPVDPETGRHKALLDGADFARRVSEWDAEARMWAAGMRSDFAGGWRPLGDLQGRDYEDWAGRRPDAADYMPQWPDAERTHLMMYETTTEGTPISPAFETPEELARWLVDNKASAFGSATGSYEGWLRVARGGWAPSIVFVDGVCASGVDAL